MPIKNEELLEPADSHFSDEDTPRGAFLDWLMPQEVGSVSVATSTSETFRGTAITAPAKDEGNWLYVNFGNLQNGFAGEQADWPKISLARLHAKNKIGDNESPTDANSLVLGNIGAAGEIDVWLGLDSDYQIMMADNGNIEGMNFNVLRSWV